MRAKQTPFVGWPKNKRALAKPMMPPNKMSMQNSGEEARMTLVSFHIIKSMLVNRHNTIKITETIVITIARGLLHSTYISLITMEKGEYGTRRYQKEGGAYLHP